MINFHWRTIMIYFKGNGQGFKRRDLNASNDFQQGAQNSGFSANKN